MPKVTKAEKKQRVDKVMELIASGLLRREILQYTAEKTTWNVSERMIDYYIEAANNQFVLESKFDPKRETRIAERRFSAIFKAAMKVQDYQRAISAEWKRCELLGLPQPQTLRILQGVDERQLQALAEALTKRGQNIGELITALHQEVAASDGSDIVH